MLCYPAILNGFPLIYSDSGTYLIAAKWKIIPIDRPVMYSLLLYGFWKLFGVISLPFFQAALVLYIVNTSTKHWLMPDKPRVWAPLMLIILSLVTGLPHQVSQIMPDLFTPFLFLLLGTLFFGKDISKKKRVLLQVISLLIVAMHSTHVLIMLAIVPIAVLIHWLVYGEKKIFKYLIWLLPIALIIPFVNLVHSGRMYFSDSSKVFFVASMHTNQALLPWLDRYCGEEGAPKFLCERRSELSVTSGNDILWGSDILLDSNCLNHGGWGECWKQRNEELSYLSTHWFSDLTVLNIWLENAFLATVEQFSDFGIGMITSQKEHSSPYAVLNEISKGDLKMYQQSKQYQDDLYFFKESDIQRYVVFLSAAILLLFFQFGRRSTQYKPWVWLVVVLAAYLLVNAAVCGVLSNPVDRYQARVIWLVPFFAMILLTQFLKPQFRK